MNGEHDYLTLARQRLNTIQNEFLADNPHGKMTVARLRAAFDRPCGDEPETARVSLSGLTNGYGFDPFTPLEQASWIAFSLYGFHQQGIHYERMHVNGATFTQTLRRLRSPRARTVVNHLHRASDPLQAGRLLLTVVRECRDKHVGFDHALLALDLADVGTGRFDRRTLPMWTAAAA